ncbi:MAG TPA: NfeD family protein [Bacillota bacterium]|nr:NfeD family protein [Bacillota bacterium]HNT04248.1 NfeD family protein [Bacillota bacterium]HPA55025.1 NfeD family protein [Bacillota bacterium]HPX70091.1 NfeD family protein [Bacillota bacterium]HQA65969.1 NfeD family protein [Bacillota bacterium]
MFGDWGLLTAFLYVTGMVLLMIEALMPGFGVAGISGIVLVLASIVMISSSFFQAILLLVGTTAIAVILVVALYRMGYGKRFVKSMILNTEQKNEEGYVSTKGYEKYLGMRGTVATPLRSAGTVIIDGNKIDAVSEAEFIDKGIEVEVIKIEGGRIVVKRI